MVVVQNLLSSAFKFRDGQVYLAKSTQALPIRWSRTLPDGATPSTLRDLHKKNDPIAMWV